VTEAKFQVQSMKSEWGSQRDCLGRGGQDYGAPTNPQRKLCQGIEDYETKVSITLRMRGQSPQARGPLDALVGHHLAVRGLT
jgi:hypothetical protein